jgi:hypothetical protein
MGQRPLLTSRTNISLSTGLPHSTWTKAKGQWTLRAYTTRTHVCGSSSRSCALTLRLCSRFSPFFFILIAERDIDDVVEEISVLTEYRRVYSSRWE